MTAGNPSGAVRGRISRLLAGGTVTGMSDTELLERFAERGPGSEAAFEVIVKRHGPMVLNVCHRVLGNRTAAEDAFQATFLLLAQRSGRLYVRHTLAPWLHEVARRTALKARTAARRLRTREQQAAETNSVGRMDPEPVDDLGAILHQEIDGLPLKYRAVVVHCYLEGRTHEDAAALLGWPVGTVRGRLSRARGRLQTRLIRRGIAPTLAVGTLTAMPGSASASVPARLIEAAVGTAIGQVPATVAVLSLTGVALHSLTITRTARVMLFAAVFIGCGSGAYLLIPKTDASSEQETEAPTPPPVRLQREGPGPRDRLGDPLPQAAIARIGSMRLRHGRSIHSTIYSPDGRKIASSGRGVVRIWDTSTGRELQHLATNNDLFALSPDWTMLATRVQDRFKASRLVLHDVATGRSGPCSINLLLKFSPDGKILAVNNRWSEVYLYDVPTLEERHIVVCPDGRKNNGTNAAFAFTPDSKTLITVTDSVRLWDVTTGNQLKQFPLDPRLEFVSDASVLPDGKTLTLSFHSTRTTLFIDLTTGTEIRRIKSDALSSQGTMAAEVIRPKAEPASQVNPALDSPMDRFSIRIKDATSGREIIQIPGHPRLINGWGGWGGESMSHWWTDGLGSVRFSPDNQTLASFADEDDRIALWDLKTGKERFPDPARSGFNDPVQFTADSQSVITGDRDGKIRFWDPRTGVERYQIDAHESSVTDLAISADGKVIISRGQDGPAKLWDVASRQEFRRLVLPWEPGLSSFVLSDDGRTLLAGCPNRHLIDLATVQDRGILPRGDLINMSPSELINMSPRRAKFTPGGRTVIGTYPEYLLEIDAYTGKTLRRFDLKSKLGKPVDTHDVAISPDGTKLAVADQAVYLLDRTTGKLVTRLPAPRAHKIQSLAFSPDGRYLAAGDTCFAEDRDGATFWFWEVASGKLIRWLASTHRGSITSLKFSPDSSLLGSTSFDDSTSVIWDVVALLRGPGQ